MTTIILTIVLTIIATIVATTFFNEKFPTFLRKKSECFIKKEETTTKENVVINTPYVIKTHTDADGAGPAILAEYFLGKENVTVIQTPNATMDKSIYDIMKWEIQCPTTIFITDISCKIGTARKLENWLKENTHVKIVLLDHHKTALELNDVSFCKVKVEKDENSLQILETIENGDYGLNCGTSLFYEYLTNEMGLMGNKTIEEFVNITTAYDTWMWKTHLGENVLYKKWNEYFHLLGWDFYIDAVVEKLNNENLSFTEKDTFIFDIDEAKKNAYVERKMKALYFRKWNGYTACFVQVDEYLADVQMKIFETYEEVDIVAMVTSSSISLRSKDKNVDVSEIAKKFGGGGHTNAAGFRVDWEILKKFYWNFK